MKSRQLAGSSGTSWPARRPSCQRSNADLEQFSYIASHDLQEPLAGRSPATSSCCEDRLGDASTTTSRHWVDRIRRAAGRMSSLLTDLLAYARAGAAAPDRRGRSTSTWRCASPSTTWPSPSRRAAPRCAATASAPVMATPSDLAQIFQNLVGNAVKFRGETAPAVSVTAAKRSGDRRRRLRGRQRPGRARGPARAGVRHVRAPGGRPLPRHRPRPGHVPASWSTGSAGTSG